MARINWTHFCVVLTYRYRRAFATLTICVFIFSCYFFIKQQSFLLPNKLNQRPRVIVGILADWTEMGSRVYASKQTWISQLSYDICYFVGTSKRYNVSLPPDSNTIVLPYDDDEYPPINKTFAMWSHFYKNYAMNYDHFVVADTDTYINVKQLQRMINGLNCRDCYVGYPGWGGESRKRLGINAPYCYGLGYVISRSVLLKFGPYIDICRLSIVARHSDTEVGRCIYKYAHNLPCSKPSIPFEAVWYTVNEEGKKVGFHMNKRNQMQIEFPKSPPTSYFRAVMVHPLKKPIFFYRFHEQITFNLRPVISPVFAEGSCVANPVLQQEMFPQSSYIPECPPVIMNKMTRVNALPAYVLTKPGDQKHIMQLIDAFSVHGIHIKTFSSLKSDTVHSSAKLTVAQWSVRRMMARILQDALIDKLERMLILEDDAIPHRDFRSSLEKLLYDNRCGECILDDHSGGLLILGTTLWKDGWAILERLSRNETGLCRNVCTKEIGSFAVLYHKASFKPILSWLDSNVDDPYEKVFSHLSRVGYCVRFAYPNLVIKDVTLRPHISIESNNSIYYDTNSRAYIHRWTLSNYMFTRYNSSYEQTKPIG